MSKNEDPNMVPGKAIVVVDAAAMRRIFALANDVEIVEASQDGYFCENRLAARVQKKKGEELSFCLIDFPHIAARLGLPKYTDVLAFSSKAKWETNQFCFRVQHPALSEMLVGGGLPQFDIDGFCEKINEAAKR